MNIARTEHKTRPMINAKRMILTGAVKNLKYPKNRFSLPYKRNRSTWEQMIAGQQLFE